MTELPEWLPRVPLIRPFSEAEHEAVRVVQNALRVPPTGELDEATQAALRGYQRLFGLTEHGFIDGPTGALIDRIRWVR